MRNKLVERWRVGFGGNGGIRHTLMPFGLFRHGHRCQVRTESGLIVKRGGSTDSSSRVRFGGVILNPPLYPLLHLR
jgi:hypothetical protein